MKIKVVMDMDLGDAERPEAAVRPEQLHGWAVQMATIALGNVLAGEEPRGLVKDEKGRTCGYWEVKDLPAPAAAAADVSGKDLAS